MPVADLVLYPVEVDLQLLWAVGHRSEYSEPSGLRDSCDHVAAVGEREDRELDVEQFGDGRVHGPTLWVQAAPDVISVVVTQSLWDSRTSTGSRRGPVLVDHPRGLPVV